MTACFHFVFTLYKCQFSMVAICFSHCCFLIYMFHVPHVVPHVQGFHVCSAQRSSSSSLCFQAASSPQPLSNPVFRHMLPSNQLSPMRLYSVSQWPLSSRNVPVWLLRNSVSMAVSQQRRHSFVVARPLRFVTLTVAVVPRLSFNVNRRLALIATTVAPLQDFEQLLISAPVSLLLSTFS